MAGLRDALMGPPQRFFEGDPQAYGPEPAPPLPAQSPFQGAPPPEGMPLDPMSEEYQRYIADLIFQNAMSAGGRGAGQGVNDLAQEALGAGVNFGLGGLGYFSEDPGVQALAGDMRSQSVETLAPYLAAGAAGPVAGAVGSKIAPHVIPAAQAAMRPLAAIPGATTAGRVAGNVGKAGAVAGTGVAGGVALSGANQAMGQQGGIDPAQFADPLPGDIREAQVFLAERGLYPPNQIDGKDGPATRRAMQRFGEIRARPEIQNYIRDKRAREGERADNEAAAARNEAEARKAEQERKAREQRQAEIADKRQYYNTRMDEAQAEQSTGETMAEYIATTLPVATGLAGLGKGVTRSFGRGRRYEHLGDEASKYAPARGGPATNATPAQREGFVNAYDKATAPLQGLDKKDGIMYGALATDFGVSFGKGQFFDKPNKDAALEAYYGPEGTPADADAAVMYAQNEELMREFSNSAVPAAITYTAGKFGGEALTDAVRAGMGKTVSPPFQATNVAETFRAQNAAEAAAARGASQGQGVGSILQRITSALPTWKKGGAGFKGNKFTPQNAKQANQRGQQVTKNIAQLAQNPATIQVLNNNLTQKGTIHIANTAQALQLSPKQLKRLIAKMRKDGIQLPPSP